MAPSFKQALDLYAQNDLAGAAEALRAEVKENPGDQKAHFILGLVEIEQGHFEQGKKRIDGPAAGYTPDAPFSHRYGRLLFDRKDYAGAEQWFRKALQKNPALAQSHYWLGNIRRMQGSFEGAEKAFREAIRLAPGQARNYVGLAFLYREHNRLEDAAETMMKLARTRKGDSETLQRVARFMEEIQRFDLAEKLLSQVLPGETDNPVFLTKLGQLRQKLGLFDEAAQVYRRAIMRDPSSDAAYLGLAVVKKFESPDEADVEVIRQAMETEGISEEGRACAHFAMGKIHNDCGAYDSAFSHFEKANQMKAEKTFFDREKFSALMERLKTTFSEKAYGDFPKLETGQPTPVFIVGMLRSGTTLAESILNAHPKIFGAGELNFIDAIAEGLGKEAGVTGDYPGYLKNMPANILQEAANYYRSTLRGYSAGEPFVIDKNPLNFRHLGLIAILFPHAKVVHCRRDPMDTCLSIYFQNFANEVNAYAYRQEDIGTVYGEYKALMDFWYKNLPVDIFDLDYEELVKAPERAIRRLVDFIGVEWDEKCLEFHENSRHVSTASLWQVRQPLYKSSMERWRNYEKHLSPLRETLKNAGLV